MCPRAFWLTTKPPRGRVSYGDTDAPVKEKGGSLPNALRFGVGANPSR